MITSAMMFAMRDEMMKAAGLPPEVLARLHGVADTLVRSERAGKPAALAAKKLIQPKSLGGMAHPAIGGGKMSPDAVDWGGF